MSLTALHHNGKWLLLIVILTLLIVVPAAAQGDHHVVQPGETLYRIALRYGLTMDDLIRANNLVNPNRIIVGQTLSIPGTTPAETAAPAPNPAPEPVATAPVYHVVRTGETLGIIARQYGLTWQDIATQNNIPNPNRILVGQQLVIMTASAPDTAAVAPVPVNEPVVEAQPVLVSPPEPTAAPITTTPEQPTTRTHIVQPGQHLASIARQYGVSWSVIAQANNITDPNRIYAGQNLTIPGVNAAANTNTYLEPTTGSPAGPAPTITNGKQIIVDLSEQRIYAYQNGELQRTVIVSTGLPGTPTVLGDYNIYWKLNAQTMSGPGYYLPGVPWVMYFYQGYAIHGTYWHNNFGQPMSHGCVNLPTEEALWFFNYAEVGTPVRVIY